MEIRYKLYPYPVMAYYSDDYKKDEFKADISPRKDGYNIKIDFCAILSNEGINNLISSRKAKYVYHIECSQTGYRYAYLTEKKNDAYILSHKSVSGKVQICPFIVAMEDIYGYKNDEFHDDYAQIPFDIEAGCVLAVGKQVSLYIEKSKDDFTNAPSIFSIHRNSDLNVKQMLIDMSYSKIIIKLPMNDYYGYKQLSKVPEMQSLLNSLTIIPALIYILEELRFLSVNERGEYQDQMWYRVLKKILKSNFECDIESDEFNQKNMVELAQKLINDPLSDALKMLSNGVKNYGGEED